MSVQEFIRYNKHWN